MRSREGAEMRVTVRISPGLVAYAGGKSELTVELAAGATLETLLETIRVPRGEVGVALINETLATEDDAPLHPDDVVELLPVVAGG